MKGKMRVIAFALTLILFITTVVNDTTLLQVSASDVATQTEEATQDIIDGTEDAIVTDQSEAVAPLDEVTEPEADLEEDNITESDASLSAGLDAIPEDLVAEVTADAEDDLTTDLEEEEVLIEEELPVEAPTAEFEQSVDMGDIIVHIYAAPGVLPNDVSVAVSALSGTQATTAEETVESLLAEEVELIDTFSYDITFTTPDGDEVQPAGYVEVTFEEVNKVADADVSVYHMNEDLTVATQVDASVAAPDATVTDVAINASSFSVYVLTITSSYGMGPVSNATITLNANEEIILDDLIKFGFTDFYGDYFIHISTVYNLRSDRPDVVSINNEYKNGNAYPYYTKLKALKSGTAQIVFQYRWYGRNYEASVTVNVGNAKTDVSIYADDLSKVYDGQPLNGTYHADGLPAGYTIASGVTVSGTATNATTTPVATSVTVDTNTLRILDGTGKDVTSKFNLTVKDATGSLSISKRNVTITANPQTRTYSEADSFTGTVEAFNSATNTGLVNAGDLGIVVYERTSRVGEVLGVGEYNNMIGVKNTFASYTNYSVTTKSAKLKVTKASITINVQNAVKTYGDADPVFTGAISGTLQNSNDLGTISYSRKYGSVGETVWDDITITAKYTRNNNYDVVVNDGKLTIEKRKITITVDDKTKVYGEWDDPMFTGSITSGSLAFGDSNNNIVYLRDYPDWDKNEAGDDIEIIAYIAYGHSYYKNNNYDVTLDKGVLTITKRAVTITVDSKEKYFGDSDPIFTGSITSGSLVNKKDLKITYGRTPETATLENVGDIIDLDAFVTGKGLKNYEISVVKGKLSIIKAPAIGTITAVGFTKTYDGVAQALTAATAADTAESIYDITYSVDGGEFTSILPEFKYVKTDSEGIAVPYLVTIKATTARYEDVTTTVEVLIAKKAISIQAETVTLPDSALPIIATQAAVAGGTSLAAGDVLAAVTVTGTVTAIGSGSSVPSNAVIKDASQTDVTYNYEITYLNGLLTAYDGTGPAPIPEEVILIPEEATALEAEIPTVVRAIRPVEETVEVETLEVEEEEPEVIEEEETPLAPEIEEEATVIEEEETPLAALAPVDCWIHWLILVLSLLYGAYAVIRTVARAKKISELSEGATDKDASSRI